MEIMKPNTEYWENAEYIKKALEGINEFTELVATMPPFQTAFVCFMFLPFFILVWLALMKLLEIKVETRKWLFLIITVAYFTFTYMFKIESEKDYYLYKLEERVLQEMTYRMENECFLNDICQSLNITESDMQELHLSKPNYFHISTFSSTRPKLIISHPKTLEIIKKKKTDLIKKVKAEKNIPVDRLKGFAIDLRFGRITDTLLKELSLQYPDITLIHKSNKQIISAIK